MSATTLPAPLRDPAPSLGRLTQVELRKTVDTRAGRWMLAVIALLTVGVTVVFVLAAESEERNFTQLFQVLQVPTGVLLPVLGILLVTSEWSQRTALTTFTLVPVRERVIAAKTLAVVVLAFAAVVLTLLFAALGTIGFGSDGSWEFGLDPLAEIVVMQLAGMLGGLAFGLAFQTSAPAIVLYFVLPTVFGVLGEIIPGADDVMRWIDIGQSTLPLGEGETTGKEWARFGTSVAVWVALPALVGLWRLRRTEIK
jgi:ABC-type transport system involved in multi-copper enzyme maturation permease subunit